MVPESQRAVSDSYPENSCFAQSRKSTTLIQTAMLQVESNNPLLVDQGMVMGNADNHCCSSLHTTQTFA